MAEARKAGVKGPGHGNRAPEKGHQTREEEILTATAIIRNSKAGDQFGWALAVSLGLHLLIIAAVIVWPSGGQKRILFAPTYQVSLVAAPPLPAAPAKKPAAAKRGATQKRLNQRLRPNRRPSPSRSPRWPSVPKKRPRALSGKKKKAEPDPDKILAQRLASMRSKHTQDQQLAAALNKVKSKVGSSAGGRRGLCPARRRQRDVGAVPTLLHRALGADQALLESARGPLPANTKGPYGRGDSAHPPERHLGKVLAGGKLGQCPAGPVGPARRGKGRAISAPAGRLPRCHP